MNRNRKSLLAIAATAVTALLLAGCSGGADGGNGGGSGDGDAPEVRTLRMATPTAEQSVQGQSLVAWAKDLEEATDGTIRVEFYHASSLLAGTEIIQGVGDGRADLGMSYAAYHANDLPYWGIVALPFATDSWDVMEAAFKDLRAEFPAVDEVFAGMGVKHLGAVSNGAATSGTERQVSNIAQMDGLRFRTPGLMAVMVERGGADAVFMDLSEAYEALQRGILDGYFGIDFGVAAGYKLEEVSPYIVDYGVGMYTSGGIFINQGVYDSLTADQQAAFDRLEQEYPSKLIPLVTELEAAVCDQVLDAGAQLVTIEKDAAYEQWRSAALEGLTAKLIENAVATGIDATDYQAFMDRYVELIAEYEPEIGDNYTDGFMACVAR